MNTDIIRSTALYDSAVEASWGKDSRVLWQWKGAGICVFCFCVWGGWGWWWWFLVSVHTPPPITSCSPWHRGKEFAIWRRPGCTLDMAAPAGLQWRPGACIGSVYWLGDKFPVVFWEVWARGGGRLSGTLFSFVRELRRKRARWGLAVMTPGKHLSDNVAGAKWCLREIRQHV